MISIEPRHCLHCGKHIGEGKLDPPTPENLHRWSLPRSQFFMRYKVDKHAICLKCIYALDPERFSREGILIDADGEPAEVPRRASRYF